MILIGLAQLFASFAVAAAPGPAPLSPRESLPEKLKIDGDLGEWDGPPTAVLGAADQVAGPSKIESAADFSARIWIAVSADGVALAGEVTDDAVRFPEGARVVNADHAELWIAFPGVALPPVGWGSQFGEHTLGSPGDCASVEGMEEADVPACKAWFAEQQPRRATLERAFARQFLLTPAGISEAWATASATAKAPATPNPARCCAASEAAVVKGDRGWRFEARIGLGDLPPLSSLPLKRFQVEVDVADADQSIDALETFVSSSRQRQFGKPGTFNPVTLAHPITWDTQPALLGRLLGAAGKAGQPRFYFPGRPVTRLGWFENAPLGYQYVPSEPSPSYREVSTELKKERSFGAVDLYRGPDAATGGPALWSFAGGVPAGSMPIGTKLEPMVERGRGLHLLSWEVGMHNSLGTGPCGACPRVSFWLYEMDGAGRLKELLRNDLYGGLSPVEGEDHVPYEKLSVHASPDLSTFGYSATDTPEEKDGKRTPWKREWRWDATKRRYLRVPSP